MRITSDLHTHSTYSKDAKGTVLENVEAARKKGIMEIAITEHGPGHMGYGIKRKDFKKFKADIEKAREMYPDMDIKMGIEANIIGKDGSLDVDDDIIRDVDILLAGFHFGSKPNSFKDGYSQLMNIASRFLPFLKKGVKKYNTTATVNAVKKYNIDILTHPGAKAEIDIDAVAKAAAENNTMLEINSSHGHLTVPNIKKASEHGVKFTINSDAHVPENIGNHTDALNRVKASGIDINMIHNIVEE